ncbi:MAG: hypothetical protein QOF09_894, partial [Alphaproteobacteria bacterium]|nr:hypothetical protein [Alphaproteobacteria bacterium]
MRQWEFMAQHGDRASDDGEQFLLA